MKAALQPGVGDAVDSPAMGCCGNKRGKRWITKKLSGRSCE